MTKILISIFFKMEFFLSKNFTTVNFNFEIKISLYCIVNIYDKNEFLYPKIFTLGPIPRICTGFFFFQMRDYTQSDIVMFV